MQQEDPQKAYFLEEIPPSDFDAMVEAAEKFLREEPDDAVP